MNVPSSPGTRSCYWSSPRSLMCEWNHASHSDGSIVAEEYYNQTSNGFGGLVR